MTKVTHLTLDERVHGWDIAPTFNYQSGNPYGDPLNFPDPHCLTSSPTVGCVPNPTSLSPLANGPDPYTGRFDAPGSFKGPSWLTMNLAIAHDLTPRMKANFLITNVFTSVHNQGYPWEFPTRDQVLAYQDNNFYYSTPLPSVAYNGDNYFPYSPGSVNPTRQYIFGISMKL